MRSRAHPSRKVNACRFHIGRVRRLRRRALAGAGNRAPSCQSSAITGRCGSDDGRSTASRTKVTPSGSAASARIRQTGTAAELNACACGSSGIGSLLAMASARCAMNMSICSGVVPGHRQQDLARRGGEVDAGLTRIDGEIVGEPRGEPGRHRENSLQLAHRRERAVGRDVLLAGRGVLVRLRAVGAREIVRIPPVLDLLGERLRGRASSPPTFCSRPFSSGSVAMLRSMRAASSIAVAVIVVSPSSTCGPDRRASTRRAMCAAGRARRRRARPRRPPIARACATDSAFRAESASECMLNAKPLAMTVSITVSQSAATSAMPSSRISMHSHAAAALRVVGGAARLRRAPRLDDERRPRGALLRLHVDPDQQRQALRSSQRSRHDGASESAAPGSRPKYAIFSSAMPSASTECSTFWNSGLCVACGSGSRRSTTSCVRSSTRASASRK